MSTGAAPNSESTPTNPSPKGGWNWFRFFSFLAAGVLFVALFLPLHRPAREAARRTQCKNNLKMISLALHSYRDEHGGFPPAFTVDDKGKPLHSWRTLILPYLGRISLYDSIDLTRPWDDPVNARAAQASLSEYRCPSFSGPANHATYLGCLAPQGCFQLTEPRALSEITDGASETLMVLEVPADRAVPWMSPQDAEETLVLSLGPDSKFYHTGGTHAARCDGSVLFFSENISKKQLHALFTIAGGETVE